MNAPQPQIRNDQFDPRLGYNRGRSVVWFALWQICKWLFFRTIFPWPSPLKVTLLRLFGANIGARVYIKPQVNIHLPWKLTVGAHTWIGEEVFLLNLEPIQIGAHACISQRAFLCTGNHDYRHPAMSYRNAPIRIGSGAWVGAQTFIGPGVTVEENAVVAAGSVITGLVPGGMVVSRSNPTTTKPRFPQPPPTPTDRA
jgi:putative colanic acid biosynthesis acetyltransferase WcaF